MLGYPLDNSQVILKRYVSESMASLDELRARVREHGSGGGIIDERPMDLPYSVGEMWENFLQLHHHSQQQQQN